MYLLTSKRFSILLSIYLRMDILVYNISGFHAIIQLVNYYAMSTYGHNSLYISFFLAIILFVKYYCVLMHVVLSNSTINRDTRRVG